MKPAVCEKKVPDPVYTTTLATLLAAFTYNQKILQPTTLLGHFLTVLHWKPISGLPVRNYLPAR